MRVKVDGTPVTPPPRKTRCGGKYEEVVVDGEVCLKRTAEWRQLQDEQMRLSKMSRAGLPTYVSDLTLDDYYIDPTKTDSGILTKLKTYLMYFDDKYKGIHLYLWSHENGTQKTTTASVLGKELLFRGHSVQFVLMGDMLRTLSSITNEDKQMVDACRKKWCECDFLIIDDAFDRKKAVIYRSGWQISFLDSFLRQRLEVDRKATCFTSNFAVDEIDVDVFGQSLKNLVKRSILEPFHFENAYDKRNDFNPDDLWSAPTTESEGKN